MQRRYFRRALLLLILIPLALAKGLAIVGIVSDVRNTWKQTDGWDVVIFFVACVLALAAALVTDLMVSYSISIGWPPHRWYSKLAVVISVVANILLALAGMLLSIAGGMAGHSNMMQILIGAFIAEIMAWVYLGLMVSVWIALKDRPAAIQRVTESG
jgi:heme/copper-type cytochrome/quinol oxidase subunit 3